MLGAPLTAKDLGQPPGLIRTWVRQEKAAGRLIERRPHAEPSKSARRRAVFYRLPQTLPIPEEPHAPEVPDMFDREAHRSAFEAWLTEGGKWPASVERDSNGEYILAQAATAWTVWCAAARSLQHDTRAPRGAKEMT